MVWDSPDVDDYPPPGHGEDAEGSLARVIESRCARCDRPDAEKPVGYRCPCGRVKGQEAE